MANRAVPDEWVLVESWKYAGLLFEVLKSPTNRWMEGHYCGYCTFPKKLQFSAEQVDNAVSVHGGVTFNTVNEDGTHTIGFDCAHAGDDTDPETKDMNYLKKQCRRLATGVRKLQQQALKIEETK